MPRITLLLHNIRSTHNIGAIFRTAEGFGVEKIILSGYSPFPPIPGDRRLPHETRKLQAQIHKTALGAEELVPFEYHADPLAWLKDVQQPVIALEQHRDSHDIGAFPAPEEFVLVLGEEVEGIQSSLLERATAIVEIPMNGHKESFNVSVATGIALYALTRGLA